MLLGFSGRKEVELFQNVDDAPSFELTHGACGNYANFVSYFACIFCVMSVHGGLAFDFFAIQGMGDFVVHRDFHRFAAGITSHYPD
jgi:hypothetical protein